MEEKKKHVDEENLKRFLCTKYENEGRDIDSDMMRSVNQLVNLIFFKHFSSYYNDEDLRQTAMCALTNARVLTDAWRDVLREKYKDNVKFEKECRKHYDPSLNVMNFAYTTVRNEVHNTIVKVCREVGFDDLNPHTDSDGGNLEDCVFYKNNYSHMNTDELPAIARKYFDFLCGDTNRSMLLMPRLDALALLIYLTTSNPKNKGRSQYSELLGRTLSGDELCMYNILKDVWMTDNDEQIKLKDTNED